MNKRTFLMIIDTIIAFVGWGGSVSGLVSVISTGTFHPLELVLVLGCAGYFVIRAIL